MAEILLEPTSLSKIIPLSLEFKDTNGSNAAQLITKRQFNTADTDAWFEIKLTDFIGTSGNFNITLFNLNDKSVFNPTGKPFTTNPFYYKLDSESDETTNEIRHAGRWIGQIVVTLANGDSATRKFIFDIEGHILDGADVQTILLEDYNALIALINTSKDLLTQYNVDYAALLVDLAAAETARTNTYNQLVADQQANIDAFDVALDTGIVAANLATKLHTFEATNNSRLLSAEQQLADIADTPSGAVINNNATAITALNFNLKKIDSRKFLTLPTFETNFDNPNDDISLFAKNDEAVATAITTGKITFKSGVADAETFFKSPFTFDAGSYYVKIEVKEDSPNTWYNLPRVGIAKDADNWILGNVDKNNNKASFMVKQNGFLNEYAATTIVRDNFPAPYNLIFATNGFTAYLIHEKDGVYTTLTNWAQTSEFNFSGVTNLATYKAAVGARTTVGNGYLDVSGFECGYTNGMSMGADFKPFTYEDGSLMQEGNCIYFTGSVHSTEELNGTGGASIYKLNLSTYQIEFVGRLFQKLGANAFGGASYKVFYDRNRKQWVVTASNFDFIDRQLTIGFTSADLRSGVHVINTQAIASIAGYVWDNDIIYKDGAYLMTYNQSDGTLHLVQSTDLLTWTNVLTKAVTGEGNVFTRVNGNYYILRAKTTAGLTVFDLNLNEVGALVTNKWSTLSGFDSPCWGFLCPFSVDDKTNYFLVSFSASLWENRHYTYGNVWVLKALETASGVEFVNKSLQVINA